MATIRLRNLAPKYGAPVECLNPNVGEIFRHRKIEATAAHKIGSTQYRICNSVENSEVAVLNSTMLQ